MTSVLITGFEPFNEYAVNPSQTIAEHLSDSFIGDARVIGLTLPVAFGRDTELMTSAIDEIDPAVILSLGLDADAHAMKIEMFAINRRIIDDHHTLGPIVEDGPAAYFATIDVDRVGKAMGKQAGVPVVRHGYAGSYLCNHVFYQTLHYARLYRPTTQVGFIHTPFADDQPLVEPGRISLPIDRMLDAVTVAIREALLDQH